MKNKLETNNFNIKKTKAIKLNISFVKVLFENDKLLVF